MNNKKDNENDYFGNTGNNESLDGEVNINNTPFQPPVNDNPAPTYNTDNNSAAFPGNPYDSYSTDYTSSSGNPYEQSAPAYDNSVGYSNYQNYQTENTMKSNGNWPGFLQEQRGQIFFGIISLLLSFISGLGIFPAAYYLFFLDKTVEKDTLAKYLNWGAFAIPLIGIILSLLLFLLIAGLSLSL